MVARIFFVVAVALPTVQGLNANNLSKRNIADDLKSKLQSAASNLIDTATKLTEAAELQAKLDIQEILDHVKEEVEKALAIAKDAVAKIKGIAQEIADKVKDAIDKAKQVLSDLKDKAEAKIASFIEQLKEYGEAALTCVYGNRDNITSVIESAASKVISCTIAVGQEAEPIVKDAIETAARLADLGAKAATITATCGAASIAALPCVLAQGVAVLGQVASDITTITKDVTDIVERAPGLIQEIESCSAEVKTATSNVNSLIGNIQKCVDDYTSSAA